MRPTLLQYHAETSKSAIRESVILKMTSLTYPRLLFYLRGFAVVRKIKFHIFKGFKQG